MPRFAANISTMFCEAAFADRYAAAAEAGFRAVELQFPYDFPAETLVRARAVAGLEQVLINLPPGDHDAGERGLACLPGREHDFAEALKRGLDYAAALDCPRVHMMAGLLPEDADAAACRATFLANLARAAEAAARYRVTVLIEPINPRDMPGYFLTRQAEAHALVAELGAANVAVQMDLYHCQVAEGDLSRRIERHIAGVGHFQIAGVPERAEPDRGEVNYPSLFALIDRLGYAGWIGCEYRPRGTTRDGLGWLAPYL